MKRPYTGRMPQIAAPALMMVAATLAAAVPHQPSKPAKPAPAPSGETPPAPATPPQESDGNAPPRPVSSFPHPMITEVLYAVPSGDTGDANGDGTRQATGDEFIELFNPHDKPISLRGYTLTDKSGGKPGSMKFVFPACTLQPGQCAVVFNGFECTWTGPVGDSMTAPKEGHKKFHGALVFSMKIDSSRIALSNSGDAVVLVAPDGAALEAVKWGKLDKAPTARVVQEAPTTNRGSVQRTGIGGPMAAHEGTGSPVVRYSPGLFAPGAGGGASQPAADPPAGEKKPAKGK